MSKKKKHKPHEEEGGEAWLLPYSDLMTLLLAVFIVLFAVSNIDKAKSEQMAAEFSEQMMNKSYNAASAVEVPNATPTGTAIQQIKNEMDKMEALKAELDAKLKDQNLTSSVKTSIDERGLVISLNNAIFFDPGSAELKIDTEETLLEIGNTISVMNNYIRVEGHTDNVPMNSSLYRSNWDLSAARAANMVRLLTGQTSIPPERLIAVGYGEYRPVADNSTEEGRAKNRRIDIIVLSEKYDDLEQ
jgi:chemotaxis protein MotB